MLTEPRITTDLTEGSGTSTNKVVVDYGAEDLDAGVFNKYVFVIDNTPGSKVEKAHDVAERKVTFDQSIEAGHINTITAHTVSGTEQSDSINVQVTTSKLLLVLHFLSIYSAILIKHVASFHTLYKELQFEF